MMSVSRKARRKPLLLQLVILQAATIIQAFSPADRASFKSSAGSSTRHRFQSRLHTARSSTNDDDDDVFTVQILMSDTGGGHRASANALRDAFDVLHPGKIEVGRSVGQSGPAPQLVV
jgi:hypothetical protein